MSIPCSLVSLVLVSVFSALAYGAEFPTALRGEAVSNQDGWRNTVALRGLSFSEGRLVGRGDLSLKPPEVANKHCMRIDTAITGAYSLISNGDIESMEIAFPSPAGPRCDAITVKLVFDPHSGAYVSQTKRWNWKLRVVK